MPSKSPPGMARCGSPALSTWGSLQVARFSEADTRLVPPAPEGATGPNAQYCRAVVIPCNVSIPGSGAHSRCERRRAMSSANARSRRPPGADVRGRTSRSRPACGLHRREPGDEVSPVLSVGGVGGGEWDAIELHNQCEGRVGDHLHGNRARTAVTESGKPHARCPAGPWCTRNVPPGRRRTLARRNRVAPFRAHARLVTRQLGVGRVPPGLQRDCIFGTTASSFPRRMIRWYRRGRVGLCESPSDTRPKVSATS